ncbi:cellulose-binding domain-containing protein [Planosporangium mesophilum]|uniref:Hydrolase n=1 Tax=Planosporangium mesophilum TaxID=689768 RepID=A0A8J3TA38_9ACTN|nr:cellulose-binding domain-containing protein [Planosporangium mesophilum]NJC84063.1 cellulose-binding protein [Planosporangium mesophilum]GII22933.1 hydrolase [Planosporangium mesophilum]
MSSSRILFPWRRRHLAALAAAATLLAAAGSVAVTTRASAAGTCRVDYTTNQWTGGFTANVRIASGDALHGWTVTWTYAAGQQVTSAWNATVTQSGTAVRAANVSWNGEVPAGGSTEFGFQGTWSSANPAPSDFAVNGVACGGGGSPGPTGAPTTAPPTAVPPTTAPPTTRPPTAPPTSTPPGSGGCAGAVICDGFEGQSGTTPAGSWSPTYPDCSGSGTATVDTAVTHGGARSLKITGTAGYCNHVFVASTADLSRVGANWYVRFYVRHTTQLPAAHVAFLAMNDSGQSGKNLRLGGQNGALQWNRELDDATLPEQSPAGVALSAALPTGTWNCVEFNVNGDGTMRTWLGGSQVAGLTADGTPTHDVDSQWLARSWRPSLTSLKLGWEAYGEGTDTLWFDDVAVGSSRIGC